MGIPTFPAEADAPLVVDADAVLADTVAPECFQPIAGRDAESVQSSRRVDEIEFIGGTQEKICRKARVLAAPKLLGLFITETFNHRRHPSMLVPVVQVLFWISEQDGRRWTERKSNLHPCSYLRISCSSAV